MIEEQDICLIDTWGAFYCTDIATAFGRLKGGPKGFPAPASISAYDRILRLDRRCLTQAASKLIHYIQRV
jgi:hypothetical protein